MVETAVDVDLDDAVERETVHGPLGQQLACVRVATQDLEQDRDTGELRKTLPSREGEGRLTWEGRTLHH